jgi:hypothetical protein
MNSAARDPADKMMKGSCVESPLRMSYEKPRYAMADQEFVGSETNLEDLASRSKTMT